jgi:hypothetical protein
MSLAILIRIVVLFVSGGVLGFLGDRMHWAGGVLAYRDPFLWGQALWVPVLFGGSSLAVAFGHAALRSLWRGPAAPEPIVDVKKLLVAMGTFFAAWGTSAFVPAQSFGHDAALLVAFVVLSLAVTAYLGFFSVRFAVYAASTAVVGCLVETAISSTGAFFYARPSFGIIPLWLPGLYLFAANVGVALDLVGHKGHAAAAPERAVPIAA